MDILKKYDAFMFKPLLADEAKKQTENLLTKEQMARVAIQILKRETEVLKAEGYKLTKIN